MPVITCIDDLKRLHRARTPRMFYDYAESGSYTEQTFRDNSTDFARLKLRQKVAVDMSDRRLARRMVDLPVSMPVALAPVGLTGMQHADGEIHAARAAERFGVPFCLSTMSICSIEDVAAHTTSPFMFQLYVMKDQEFLAAIIERAKAAKCSALVLTLDLQILGQRHKDLKNGLSAPPKMTLPTMLDLATRWRWGMGMLGTKRRAFGNIVGHAKGVGDTGSLMSWIAEQFDERLDWDKIAAIRDMWGGKLILKGILDPEDARIAADFGADAIVVSNHGGRQLDGALSSIRMLPHIVEAVGDRVEVHMDGGIRSGQDVLKALALGAHGTWIGRAWLHGLGAMGEAGVTRALEIIRKELDTSMALCGERDLDNVGPQNLLVPRGFLDEYQIA
ncbi:alpha-hydroxy-acid oxidizing protein [Paracoccus liaowanqingii]|uniref:Alpha-hydroxy-acid oxidizing protein n=1 Tax=Paracoccus liaowanqingii TaxID=2560053 RepID=A0A4V1BJ49_9RHOB|nr:alpha-hydroxy acid oxidase [Paracoccus liaowanqingii]QBX35052.1 alpha-hydroxy-acid oxidizing protein [Paracoccus liaowanqingii]